MKKADKMKTIFWNVDTQYDFMRPKGKLYVQGAEKIESHLARLTELAKINDIKVVNTGDWHNKETEEISDNPNFINKFPEHCMQNTLGAKFIPATNPENPYIISWESSNFDEEEMLKKRDIVLYKDKFNVFLGTPHTKGVLKLLIPEKAVVYGVATNICVNDAVNGLLKRGVQTYVVEDAIKELPNLPLEKTLYKWTKQGAKIIKTKDVEKYIGRRYN